MQDVIDEVERLLEEAHVEVQAAQAKVAKAAMPTGRGYGRNGQAHDADGGESGLSRSLKTGQRNRLLGGIEINQKAWAKWTEATTQFCSELLTTCQGGAFSPPPTCTSGNSLFSRKSTDKFADPPCRHVPNPSRPHHNTTPSAVHHRGSGGTEASSRDPAAT